MRFVRGTGIFAKARGFAVMKPASRSLRGRFALAPFLVVLVVAAFQQSDDWKSLSQQFAQLYLDGRVADALRVAERELRAAEASFGPDDARRATALDHVGLAHSGLKHVREAERYFLRAIAIFEKGGDSAENGLAGALSDIGGVYNDQQKYVEAEESYQRALAIAEKARERDHVMLASILNNLGHLFTDQQRYREAGPYLERGLDAMEKAVSPQDPRLGYSLNNLAHVRKEEGSYDEAMILYERSLGILERKLGDNVVVVSVLKSLADLYSLKGWKKEADEAAERARVMGLRLP